MANRLASKAGHPDPGGEGEELGPELPVRRGRCVAGQGSPVAGKPDEPPAAVRAQATAVGDDARSLPYTAIR